MKQILLATMLIISSTVCKSQDIDSEILSFRDFILDKSTYEECIEKLNNSNDFKYKNIKQYNNGYYYKLDQQRTIKVTPRSGFADDSYIQEFDLKNYDDSSNIKAISCTSELLEKKSEFQFYFFNNILCAISVRFPMSISYDFEKQLDLKYGEHNIEGYYKYPNIKQDWTTMCLTWKSNKGECSSASISTSINFNVSDIIRYSNLGKKYITTSNYDESFKYLSFRGKYYLSYLKYKKKISYKASQDEDELIKNASKSISF